MIDNAYEWVAKLANGDMAWRTYVPTVGRLGAPALQSAARNSVIVNGDWKSATCPRHNAPPREGCACGMYSWATVEDVAYFLGYPVVGLVEVDGRSERRDNVYDVRTGNELTMRLGERVVSNRVHNPVPRTFGVVVAERVRPLALFTHSFTPRHVSAYERRFGVPVVNYAPPMCAPRRRARRFLKALHERGLRTDDTTALRRRLRDVIRSDGDLASNNFLYAGPILGLDIE